MKIKNIPATAKLVVLLGPNGCGKSSLFDALHYESLKFMSNRRNDRPDYYQKISGTRRHCEISFHDAMLSEKSFCIRTAYRNEPSLIINQANIQKITEQTQPSTTERRFNTMIENDAAALRNVQRLSTKVHQEFIKRVKGTENDTRNV